jgi:hypothetical protein
VLFLTASQPTAQGSGSSSTAQKRKKKKKPAPAVQVVSSANPVTNQQAAFSAPPGYPFPMYQPGYPSGQYGGPQVPTGTPPSQPAPVAQSPAVIQDSSVQVEDASKWKKSVRCWKCAVESHATKDCTAIHYCLVCNTGAHPTCRCPTLKLPKPLAYFTGTGNIWYT